MTRPTAHQLIAAQGPELKLTRLQESGKFISFIGKYPKHGHFGLVLECCESESFITGVMLAGKHRSRTARAIGRAAAPLFGARFVCLAPATGRNQ